MEDRGLGEGDGGWGRGGEGEWGRDGMGVGGAIIPLSWKL